MRKLNVKDMALCALFAALCAVGALVRFQAGAVPFSMQFLFANLAGLLLGKRRGAVSIALYVFLGLAGLPVFTGGGGILYVLQPSFGYLLGMILGAYLAGALSERGPRKFMTYFLAGLANIAAVYVCGVLYFYLISRFYLGNIPTAKTLLVSCCLIFLPGDTAACAIGAAMAMRVRQLTIDN